VARVVSDPAFHLDQLRDTTGCPQPTLESQSLWPALQPALNTTEIGRIETRGPAHVPGFAQRTTSFLLQLSCPATHRLAMDADLSGHLRLACPLAQEVNSLHAALFERVKIPLDSSWISHNGKHSICHYILQDSIVRFHPHASPSRSTDSNTR
jgi:hypothetical protein